MMDSQGRFIGEEYTLALGSGIASKKSPARYDQSFTSNLTAEVAKRAGADLHRSPVGRPMWWT